MSLEQKTILITGGVGSFGQKCTEILLRKHNPKVVRIFDNNELGIVAMERKVPDPRIRFLMGDVRDRNRLFRAMHGVDIVIHAAALKHVPVCEYNPVEAIKTNINGAINCVDSALDNEVEKAILISTDKAVNPVNLYGATKLCAEKLFVQANVYAGEKRTRMGCVRYGNVVGSSGSIVPLFVEQRRNGVLTVTDERMTRFWITLEEGVRFVLECLERLEGGEIFVPKIPSTKVIELSRVIAPEAKIEITGIRLGEKLHEVLLTPEEARRTREYNTYFIIEPESRLWDDPKEKTGKELPEDFRYSSDTNEQSISADQIRKMVRSLTLKED